MNEYEVEFFARCPKNGVRIKYILQIRTDTVIPVENILTAVGSLTDGYHEVFAEQLRDRFGGLQKLVAEHHGCRITTHRSGLAKAGETWGADGKASPATSVALQQWAECLDGRKGSMS